MRASHVVPLLPLLALLALPVSCTSTSGGSTAPSTPTLVAISPDDFLGDVPCADVPGAMQRYVATLYDVTPGIGGEGGPGEFALPSSGPVPCTRQVAFGGGFVIQGHRYVADVQGYDRSDIQPLGSGSPIMVDANGAVVEPRWTTSCGRAAEPQAGDAGSDAALVDAGSDAAAGDAGSDAALVDAGSDAAAGDAGSDAAAMDAGGDAAPGDAGSDAALVDADAGNDAATPPTITGHPVVAARYTTVYVRNCSPLAAHQPPGETGISVGIDDAMRGPLGLECGDQPGQIARYRVSIEGSSVSPLETACDQRVTFSPLSAGSGYTFSLQAFEQGATTPSWGTHCFRTALSGAVVAAACDPLTDRGAIELDTSAVLAQLGLSCGKNLLSVSTELAATPPQTAVQTPPGCLAPVRFGDLVPGLYGIQVTTILDTGPGPSASCVASVSPAESTPAQCTPNP